MRGSLWKEVQWCIVTEGAGMEQFHHVLVNIRAVLYIFIMDKFSVPPSAPELSILISGYPDEMFIVPGYPMLVSCLPNSGNRVPEVDIFLNEKLVTRNGTFVLEPSTEDGWISSAWLTTKLEDQKPSTV